jgi:hypothetical protein
MQRLVSKALVWIVGSGELCCVGILQTNSLGGEKGGGQPDALHSCCEEQNEFERNGHVQEIIPEIFKAKNS